MHTMLFHGMGCERQQLLPAFQEPAHGRPLWPTWDAAQRKPSATRLGRRAAARRQPQIWVCGWLMSHTSDLQAQSRAGVVPEIGPQPQEPVGTRLRGAASMGDASRQQHCPPGDGEDTPARMGLGPAKQTDFNPKRKSSSQRSGQSKGWTTVGKTRALPQTRPHVPKWTRDQSGQKCQTSSHVILEGTMGENTCDLNQAKFS